MKTASFIVMTLAASSSAAMPSLRGQSADQCKWDSDCSAGNVCQPAYASFWVGTAPFCGGRPSDCTDRGMDYVRSDQYGDGKESGQDAPLADKADEFWKKVSKDFDENGDGKLNKAEFCVLYSRLTNADSSLYDTPAPVDKDGDSGNKTPPGSANKSNSSSAVKVWSLANKVAENLHARPLRHHGR